MYVVYYIIFSNEGIDGQTSTISSLTSFEFTSNNLKVPPLGLISMPIINIISVSIPFTSNGQADAIPSLQLDLT